MSRWLTVNVGWFSTSGGGGGVLDVSTLSRGNCDRFPDNGLKKKGNDAEGRRCVGGGEGGGNKH